MIAEDKAPPFAGEWPKPGRQGRPYSRSPHHSQRQIWTAAELAFQARLLAWCSENFPGLEADLENVYILESSKSHICACSHAWAAHRTDGADALDSACLAEAAGGYCQCDTFTMPEKRAVEAGDKRSPSGPCTDTSESATVTTEQRNRDRMLENQRRHYQANRSAIRLRQSKYYQKRKRGACASTPRVVYGQI